MPEITVNVAHAAQRASVDWWTASRTLESRAPDGESGGDEKGGRRPSDAPYGAAVLGSALMPDSTQESVTRSLPRGPGNTRQSGTQMASALLWGQTDLQSYRRGILYARLTLRTALMTATTTSTAAKVQTMVAPVGKSSTTDR